MVDDTPLRIISAKALHELLNRVEMEYAKARNKFDHNHIEKGAAHAVTWNAGDLIKAEYKKGVFGTMQRSGWTRNELKQISESLARIVKTTRQAMFDCPTPKQSTCLVSNAVDIWQREAQVQLAREIAQLLGLE